MAVRTVVVEEFLDDLEVHPPGLYQRLTDAFRMSSRTLLKKEGALIETPCPACENEEKEAAFEKDGYSYWHCLKCSSLYVSPRPGYEEQEWLLRKSQAAEFRRSNEYQGGLKSYSHSLSAYRGEWVLEMANRKGISTECLIADVETRSEDYLAILQRAHAGPVLSIKPICDLHKMGPEGGKVVRSLGNLKDIGDSEISLVSAFDVLEHQYCPMDLLREVARGLEAGGLLLLTTRSGSGFDIQVLWEHSNIFPATHTNLISVEGMRGLLDRVGFEILEASTPGQLDVQMISRVKADSPEVKLPKFVDYFLRHRDRYAKRKLQQFLQENLLSSHLRIVARKRS